jgi:hypothetical protein
MRQVLQNKVRWMTLGGQYDWTKKVYPAEAPPEFPPDIANLIRGIFHDVLDPQAAIVNIYSPGDTLSMLFLERSLSCSAGFYELYERSICFSAYFRRTELSWKS